MMTDVFFKPAYLKLNEQIEKGKCEIFKFNCCFGTIHHNFIKRKIKIKIGNKYYYDIITQYGYGGPLIIEAKDTNKLLKLYFNAFSKYCVENNIVSEFVRFHLFDNKLVRKLYYGEIVKASTNIIRDFSMSMNEIWMDFDRKVRKNVKRAEANGLTIVFDDNGEHIKEFLDIYYKTMDRNNAKVYYYFDESFFDKLNKNLKGEYAYFHVVLNKKIISTELVLYSDLYVYSFLGGTLTDYYNYRPNDFLKYEIIKWCKETNKKYFVLGGGYSEDDGIYKYKKGFAPNKSENFYVGKKIHNEVIYNKLVEIRNQESNFNDNTTFFPVYRG